MSDLLTIIGLATLPIFPILVAIRLCRWLDALQVRREVRMAIKSGIPVAELAEQDWVDREWMDVYTKAVWDGACASASPGEGRQ